MERLEKVVVNFPTDSLAWERALRLGRVALENGLRPPPADIVIMATAGRYGLSVDHQDRHLTKLEALKL